MAIISIDICPNKFRYTNKIWNELKLNKPDSVGNLSKMMDAHSFSCFQDWKDFYFNSGLERFHKAESMGVWIYNGNSPKALMLNETHGRTKNELKEKSLALFDAIVKRGNPEGLTLNECQKCVYHRVICETWNGFMMERKTVASLQKKRPNFTYKKANGDDDWELGIDYEVFNGNELLGAIQIKPKSYHMGNSPEIMQAKQINKNKHELYKQRNSKKVVYVIADNEGSIICSYDSVK